MQRKSVRHSTINFKRRQSRRSLFSAIVSRFRSQLNTLRTVVQTVTRPKRRLYFGWFGGVQLVSTGEKP
jgi:hypothetical protein